MVGLGVSGTFVGLEVGASVGESVKGLSNHGGTSASSSFRCLFCLCCLIVFVLPKKLLRYLLLRSSDKLDCGKTARRTTIADVDNLGQQDRIVLRDLVRVGRKISVG